jgi:YggT family protein
VTTVLAVTRGDVADYVNDLVWVYTCLIFLYVVVMMLFSAGFRPSYARWTDALLDFLRETCEPYVRIFRRVLPTMAGLDFSPLVALIVLRIVGSIVVSIIRG